MISLIFPTPLVYHGFGTAPRLVFLFYKLFSSSEQGCPITKIKHCAAALNIILLLLDVVPREEGRRRTKS